MRATEGEGTAERGRCRHCGESVILVTFNPDTWFHTNTRFLACRGGKTEAEVASS